jgi:hypothetical protein
MFSDICEAKVDDLDHRIAATAKYSDDVIAVSEVIPELNELRKKASERIREFMLTKIQGLRYVFHTVYGDIYMRMYYHIIYSITYNAYNILVDCT